MAPFRDNCFLDAGVCVMFPNFAIAVADLVLFTDTDVLEYIQFFSRSRILKFEEFFKEYQLSLRKI